MGKASSNKKVARAAKAGGSPSARSVNRSFGYYGGLAGISVVGILLIILSLITASKADFKTQPRPQTDKVSGGDHWHAAYGIYACDTYLPPIQGEALQTSGQAEDRYGIHAHSDGLMHIHPFTTKASGKKAKLGVWLDSLHMTLTKTKIKLPGTKGQTYKTGDKCRGRTAEFHIFSYKGENDTNPVEIKYNPRDVRLAQDMILSFALIPKGAKAPSAPPSVKTLLAPSDVTGQSGGFSPNSTSSTVAGASTTAPVSGASTTAPVAGASTTAPAAGSPTVAGGSPTSAVTTATTKAAASNSAGSDTTKAK